MFQALDVFYQYKIVWLYIFIPDNVKNKLLTNKSQDKNTFKHNKIMQIKECIALSVFLEYFILLSFKLLFQLTSYGRLICLIFYA